MEVSKMKEVRKLYGDDLRRLCIKKGWYTLGYAEEYENLLNMAVKDNITTDDIVAMATDIKNHSETDYEVKSICFEIARICYSNFED